MRKILTSVLLIAGFAGNAMAADYSYGPAPSRSWHDSYIPACDAPSVGARIVEKFAYQDAHIIHSGIGIANLSNVRETGSAPWHGRIDRRFCSATAWLSNGRKAEAVYVIEGPHLATFSVGWHVESCVTGHDPWRVYDALCRSIRP